jgi:hypothetical protein
MRKHKVQFLTVSTTYRNQTAADIEVKKHSKQYKFDLLKSREDIKRSLEETRLMFLDQYIWLL